MPAMINRIPLRRATLIAKMNTFIRMDPTEENQIIAAVFLKRI